MENRTISLVLGSGGARGLAHIGVIHWLEENGFEIRAISGCSIGALVGGVHALGELRTCEEWVCAITKIDMMSLLDIAWGKQGLVGGERIIATLRELVGDCKIEDLEIEYTAVATDITREKEVWLTEGSLFDAIRASISLPLFFAPYELNGMKLLDGGILNPLPIAPTFKDATDLTIAVNLGGQPVGRSRAASESKSNSFDGKATSESSFQIKITNFIDSFKSQGPIGDSNSRTMFDIADQTFDAMQAAIARQKLAAYPPDHTITLARDACGILEFDRAEEMIALGYETTEQTFSHI